MIEHFQERLEILPKAQKESWPHLRELQKHGFILYGGTAIALRLGHRTSVDFDFFRQTSFDPIKMYNQLGKQLRGDVLQSEADTLTVLLSGRVKLSLFAPTGISCSIVPAELTSDEAVLVASSLDLLATKLVTVQQRCEPKDYLDIEALITIGGQNLERGLAAATVIFGSAFSPVESLRAVSCFREPPLRNLSDKTQKNLLKAVQQVDLGAVLQLKQELSLQVKERSNNLEFR